MASQSSPPPADPAAPPAPADPEATRIKSIDDRFAAQDAKIDGLGSKIDQVLGKLGGAPAPAPAAAGAGPAEPPAGGLSIAEQVRRGVAEIEAEKARKAAADQADADAASWRKSVDDKLAERPPAERATGAKTRMQRFLFGRPDER